MDFKNVTPLVQSIWICVSVHLVTVSPKHILIHSYLIFCHYENIDYCCFKSVLIHLKLHFLLGKSKDFIHNEHIYENVWEQVQCMCAITLHGEGWVENVEQFIPHVMKFWKCAEDQVEVGRGAVSNVVNHRWKFQNVVLKMNTISLLCPVAARTKLSCVSKEGSIW